METGGTKSWRPRSHVIGAGEFVVTRNAEQQLVVRTADGRWEFDALAFFEMYIVIASVGHFHIIKSVGNHTSRISIGRLVIARERWRFEPAELPFLALESRLEPFVAAYRWARKIGLPRFVFVKTPEEPKPFFVDFHSPVFVEVFVKMARHASAITITEMVPDVTQAWLPDAEGQRYTSELRLAVCDDVPFPRPAGVAR